MPLGPLVSESNTDRCFPRRDEKRRVLKKKEKNNGELIFFFSFAKLGGILRFRCF